MYYQFDVAYPGRSYAYGTQWTGTLRVPGGTTGHLALRNDGYGFKTVLTISGRSQYFNWVVGPGDTIYNNTSQAEVCKTVNWWFDTCTKTPNYQRG
ncbi:MAG: hypothetical protein FWF75_07535 [Propionibacteriaceae bacterium]|nr:hypothetical protein [Propionibacteriaceae bacterium]